MIRDPLDGSHGHLTPLPRERAAIASSGPRLGGSTHSYTSWTCPNASKCRYAHMALPMPAE
jgi:hypothetical protein